MKAIKGKKKRLLRRADRKEEKSNKLMSDAKSLWQKGKGMKEQEGVNAEELGQGMQVRSEAKGEKALELKKEAEVLRKRAAAYKKGGKVPTYAYGGKVYAEKGAMLKAMLKDPKQAAIAKKELGL
tara:strand:- start:442 stop:816 length:375 start_codon:yes stop_codon:yes gene_type:complete